MIQLKRRKVRKARTPYYLTGITRALSDFVMGAHSDFTRDFGRDYEDEDPQFYVIDSTGLSPAPKPIPTLDQWLEALADAMLATRHPPAQVHAMLATRTIIFGCDASTPTGPCFDLDHCPHCNFRSVPEGWTAAWEAATRQYERWSPNTYAPTLADLLKGRDPQRRIS